MEININKFESTFLEVKTNEETGIKVKTFRHKDINSYLVLPFNTKKDSKYMIKNLSNVVNSYIRNICCIDKPKIDKEQILNNCCDNTNSSEQDKLFLKKCFQICFFIMKMKMN